MGRFRRFLACTQFLSEFLPPAANDGQRNAFRPSESETAPFKGVFFINRLWSLKT
nr:MAG TPA: hypothetical protein [Caudoviricetes sp.]